MRAPRLLLAATAIGMSFTLTTPAHADAIVNDLAGTVTGRCTYAGATVSGGMQFVFGGAATAITGDPAQPQTVIYCSLVSEAQGLPGELPTLVASFTNSCPGGSCAGVGTSEVWPMRPVEICVAAFASPIGEAPAPAAVEQTCQAAAL